MSVSIVSSNSFAFLAESTGLVELASLEGEAPSLEQLMQISNVKNRLNEMILYIGMDYGRNKEREP